MELPIEWAVPQATAFMLVVARMSGLFLLAPVFSSKLIPGKIKVTALMVLSATMMPIVVANGATNLPSNGVELAVGMGIQATVGFALGFAVSIVFTAVQVGASFIDTTIGFSLANIIDPMGSATQSIFGGFYTMVATLAFLSINGHQWMIGGFAQSFDVLPIGEMPNFKALFGSSLELFMELFVIAFQIAAPVLVTLLMVDIVLGIVSRVVPQMNVFFVGIPLKIGLGMIAVIISLPSFLRLFESELSDVVTSLSRIAAG